MIALNLTIRRKWLDLIRIGQKKEEYRTYRNRNAMRLYDMVAMSGHLPDDAIAIFRNGYSLDSAAVAIEITGLDLRNGNEAKHLEWGEPTDNELHIVISLGKVLMVSPYHDVREAFKEGGAAQ